MTINEKGPFEIDQEKEQHQKMMFDIKRYKNKPFNVTYASGMYKSNVIAASSRKRQNAQQQAAMNVYVSVNHHYNNNKELKGSALK